MLTRLLVIFAVTVFIWGAISDRNDSFMIGLSLALAIGFLELARWWFKRPKAKSWLSVGLADANDDPLEKPEEHSRRASLLWMLGGFAFFVLMLVILELKQPLFFTQDDNFALGLPGILDSCRSILSGVFPAWNPYQIMGAPAASNPMSIIFYPPVFLSLLFSKFILGNELFTNEVFTIAHMVACYFVTYRFSRYMGMRPSLAVLGSLSLVLSGFFLILGRSWSNVPMYVLYFALFAFQVEKLRREEMRWQWVVSTALLTGVTWYIANAQLWIYAMMLFVAAIVIMMAVKAVPWKRAMWVIPSFVLGAAIMSPLLIPQLAETKHVAGERNLQGAGEGIEFGAISMLAPYPVSQLPYDRETIRGQQYGPFAWHDLKDDQGRVLRSGITHYDTLPQFFYSGTLFFLIGFAVLLGAYALPFSRRIISRNYWLVMAYLTALLALGPAGGLWKLMAVMPLLDKMRGPFKFLGFLNFLVIIGAGIVLERLLRHYKSPIRTEALLAVGVGALLAYHCALPMPAFYEYGDRSYTPLPAEFASIEQTSKSEFPLRVFTMANERNPSPGFAHALHLNFSSAYRIPALGGYEPLYQASKENQAAMEYLGQPNNFINTCAAYGVQWLILDENSYQRLGAQLPPVQPVTSTPNQYPLYLLTLPKPDPLVFINDEQKTPLPIQLRGDGAIVTIPDSDKYTEATINFLKRPFHTISADGRQVDISADRWGRITAKFPAGTKELRLGYAAPWSQGFVSAVMLALLGLLIWGLMAKWDREYRTRRMQTRLKEAAAK